MSASWPPKDWRALIALLGSIGGAASLTLFVWWGVWTLLPAASPASGETDWWTGATEAHRAETIRWVLWISTGTIALVIVGLGFAINRRSFKGRLGRDGAVINFEGGDDDDDAPLAIPEPAYGKGAPPA